MTTRHSSQGAFSIWNWDEADEDTLDSEPNVPISIDEELELEEPDFEPRRKLFDEGTVATACRSGGLLNGRPPKKFKRDDSDASLRFASRELDPIPSPSSPFFYRFDPALKPLIARDLEGTLHISPSTSNETCRAYRTFPANRFMWYSLKKVHDAASATRKIARVIKYKADGETERSFTFLCTTEGRLRMDSVCFFEESDDLKTSDVRAAFGDLGSVFIKDGVGKYVARMGLSFTKTTETIAIPPEEVVLIDDIFAPDGKAYTDGCGCISEDAAGEVAEKLGLDYIPSAFQIRHGGAKGMIVTYSSSSLAEFFPRHFTPQKRLYLRPSMRKYSCPDYIHLEVADWTKKTGNKTARLQRAYVQVLDALGLDMGVVEDLLRKELDRLDSIMMDKEKTLQWLERDGADLADPDCTMINTAYRMVKAGHPIEEPRLQDILSRMTSVCRSSLREKHNIPVPESANLFGVCDETATLEPNQVYVHAGVHGWIKGKVLVTRSPWYVPFPTSLLYNTETLPPLTAVIREIFRLFEAVKPPLHSLWRDCIVFPVTGRQPAPDQMSGGDLDGDEYFVCWNESLFPPIIVAPDPRAAEPKQPIVHNQEFSDGYLVKAMQKHIISELTGSELGKTRNLWEEINEKAEQGVMSRLSIYLNKRCEICMDTNKSGERIPRMPSEEERTAWMGPTRAKGPVTKLREIIPFPVLLVNGNIYDTPKKPRPTDDPNMLMGTELRMTFQVDPDLVYKEDTDEWQKHHKLFDSLRRELAGSMAERQRAFEGRNRPMIKVLSPNKRQEDEAKRLVYKLLDEKESEMLEKFRKTHFDNDDYANRDLYTIRASALYVAGYKSISTSNANKWLKPRPSLCWLGERYLNDLKSWKVSNVNGVQGPPVTVAFSQPKNIVPA